jgi:hypothetical protein
VFFAVAFSESFWISTLSFQSHIFAFHLPLISFFHLLSPFHHLTHLNHHLTNFNRSIYYTIYCTTRICTQRSRETKMPETKKASSQVDQKCWSSSQVKQFPSHPLQKCIFRLVWVEDTSNPLALIRTSTEYFLLALVCISSRFWCGGYWILGWSVDSMTLLSQPLATVSYHGS